MTERPCYLMPRGVDAELFHPAKRTRAEGDRDQVLGFVGRLSVEKNIAGLVQVQNELEQMGHQSFRFLIVGHGGDEAWLRERLPRAEFTGVLRGEALSRAYANMDLFVFPSHTDTFGNVVLEALASGVPAVVTPDGGPMHDCARWRDGPHRSRRRICSGGRGHPGASRATRGDALGGTRLRTHGKLGLGV